MIEASNVPGTATIAAAIEPAGQTACTYTIDLTLDLKVPLIGDRFVALLRPQVMEIVDAEFEAWDRWFSLVDAAERDVLTMTTTPAIEVCGLTKRYGDVQALAGVDLEVRRGTVFGLLGPNGAGKTTTVRVLTTSDRPAVGREGARRRRGQDPERVRSRIGFAGQYAAVDERLTGRENLMLIGHLDHLAGRSSRHAPRSCWSRFRLTRMPATGPLGPTRAGCDAASTWRGRSCTARRCCSSTSRRPGWTRAAATASGASSASWWPRDHRPAHHPVPGGGRHARRRASR